MFLKYFRCVTFVLLMEIDRRDRLVIPPKNLPEPNANRRESDDLDLTFGEPIDDEEAP